MSTYIIMTGNAVDGLSMIGPFSTVDDAGGYAEDCIRNETWNIVEVKQPYKQIPFVMDAGQIDFHALRDQKSYLVDTIDNEDRIDGGHPLDGIVELLDELMDRAAYSAGQDDVFGKSDE